MNRRNIVVKAALLAAGIGFLPLQQAAAQPCGYGYYYYQGYGCRAYDYGFPVGALGGLVFGLLDHNHGYSPGYDRGWTGRGGGGGGGDGGGGFAGAVVRHGSGRVGGGVARAPEHEGARAAGFGSSAPAPHAGPHAAAPHEGGHKK